MSLIPEKKPKKEQRKIRKFVTEIDAELYLSLEREALERDVRVSELSAAIVTDWLNGLMEPKN